MNQFTIRVYALCVKDLHVLTLFEEYAGEQLVKFPGGGLEFGEGTIECLRRELDEELNLKVKSFEHFYTQEDFVASRFRQNEQLFTVYYLVELEDENDLVILDPCIEHTDWVSLRIEENPFPLPVDRIVFEKLKARFL